MAIDLPQGLLDIVGKLIDTVRTGFQLAKPQPSGMNCAVRGRCARVIPGGNFPETWQIDVACRAACAWEAA